MVNLYRRGRIQEKKTENWMRDKEDYERIKDIVKKEVMELGSTYEEDIFDKL